MSPVRFVLSRPRASGFLLLAILSLGLVALETLPRQEDPKVVLRGAQVVARLPGASAERLDNDVVVPLEKRLRGLDEIDYTRSMARPGVATIRIVLRPEVMDSAPVWQKVRARLADAGHELPAGLQGPMLHDDIQETFALLQALVSESVPLPTLDRLAEDLEDVLRAVPGAAGTERFGTPDEEILVRFDPQALRDHQLDMAAVATRLAGDDVRSPSGRLDLDGVRVTLRTGREWSRQDEIESAILVTGPRGETVRVRDLAEVTRGPRRPESPSILVDGRPAVLVGVKVLDRHRVDRFSADAARAAAGYDAALPPGVSRVEVLDQGRFTERRLDQLATSLWQSVALVTVTTALFLGLVPGLVVASILPITGLVVLAAFQALGVEIQQMSIASLVLAMGLLIDAAIVMAEHVSSRMERGADPIEAADQGVRELCIPLLMSTLTTLSAFLPILWMPGMGGEFVRTIGLGVVLALVASYGFALTYTPALTALSRRFGPAAPRGSGRKPQWYRRLLDSVLARPATAAGLLLATLLPTLGLVTALERDFFPSSDRLQAVADLWFEGGTTREQARLAASRLSAALGQDPRVVRVTSSIGRSLPLFYYNQIGTERDTEEYAQLLLELRDGSRPEAVAAELDRKAASLLPGASVVVRPLLQGPVYDAPIELRVRGPDPALRAEVAARYRSLLQEAGLFRGIRDHTGHDRVEARFIPDASRLARSDLSPEAVATTLRHRLEGLDAGVLSEGDRTVPVRVRGKDPEPGPGPADVLRTTLPGGSPLASMGEFHPKASRGGLARRNGFGILEVQAWTIPGIRPAEALRSVLPRIEAVPLPPGHSLELGGEADGRARTEGELFSTVHVAALSLLFWLYLEFESTRSVLLILSTIPLAVGSALAGLWIMGLPLGFTAILGVLALTGIVVNDAILLVDGFEAGRAGGGDLTEVVRDVTLDRTNHVLLTSLTTIAGFIPLVKPGDEFWSPLAMVVIGGLASITVITLVLIPALYLVVHGAGTGPAPTRQEPSS